MVENVSGNMKQVVVIGEAGEEKFEAMKKLMASSIPIQRLGTPEDLANTICFLGSDESTFITGVVLPVDGGKTPQLHVPDWELTLDNRDVK